MNIKNNESNEIIEHRQYIQKKVTEKIILNKPKFELKNILGFQKKLILINKKENTDSVENYIPCLFLRNTNSSKYMIFFHGNSEDIFNVENIGLYFKTNLNMNIIIVEYPGYSIYMSKMKDPSQIYSDSLIVYNWVKNKLKVSNENIFIYGRSLGTSPAIYLSSKINPKALFLVSSFTSMKDIGSDKFCSWFVEDIFKSINFIDTIKCPILFIHGKEDSLISYSHSEKLNEKAEKINNNVYLEIRQNMTHNNFDIFNDIIEPIKLFIKSKNLISENKIEFTINEGEIINLMKIPKSISLRIESEIFNIQNFKIFEQHNIKNAFYLIKLNDERIALSYDTKIGIFDDRKYTLDYEIDLNKHKDYSNLNKNCLIYYLFQMKNDNLICCTNIGDLFVFKIYLDEYEKIDYFSLGYKEEIFKIDNLMPNLLCCISSSYIITYEYNNLKIKDKKNNKFNYLDFARIPDKELIAFFSVKQLCIHTFKNNEILDYIDYHNINSIKLNHIMAVTNKYILIGAKGGIYIYNHHLNMIKYNPISDSKDYIIYIHKIHDELLLASTFYGNIIQIKLWDNFEMNFIEKHFSNLDINSLLFKNLRCVLFTNDKSLIIIKSLDEKQKQEEKCHII